MRAGWELDESWMGAGWELDESWMRAGYMVEKEAKYFPGEHICLSGLHKVFTEDMVIYISNRSSELSNLSQDS